MLQPSPFVTTSNDDFRVLGLEPHEDQSLRTAQRGALHALIGHFSSTDRPAIVSLPTGSGKTLVATAAPFLLRAERILVIVPSRVVRRQMTEAFETFRDLRQANVLSDEVKGTRVLELEGRPSSTLQECENEHVVVATPQALSLGHLTDEAVQRLPELFDLMIVDEAHHVPAPTWRRLTQALGGSQQLFLTATPFRRDQRLVPADLAFYYSIERAIDDGTYHPLEAELVDPPTDDRSARDEAVANRSVEYLTSDAYNGAAIAIRADRIDRAEDLADLYQSKGVEAVVVHHELDRSDIDDRLGRLRSGDARAVAFVGALGEGFDHPPLKIGAYHDKHKSFPATLQFLGRLARPVEGMPRAKVVAVEEELFADTRDLWANSAAWDALLPQMADEATAVAQQATLGLNALEGRLPGEIDLEALQPRLGGAIWKLDGATLEGSLLDAATRSRLVEGERLAGGTIVSRGYLPRADDAHADLLVLLTEHEDKPDWATSDELAARSFGLHLAATLGGAENSVKVLVQSHPRSAEATITKRLAQALGCDRLSLAAPERLLALLESVSPIAYSTVGLRATSSVRGGAPSYSMLSGSAVDLFVDRQDNRSRRFGHGVTTATSLLDGESRVLGVAPDSGRVWEVEKTNLPGFSRWAGAALMLTAGETDKLTLLSNLRTARRAAGWPDAAALVCEFSATLENTYGSIHNATGISYVLPEVRVELMTGQPDEDGWLHVAIRHLDGSAIGTMRVDFTGNYASELEVGFEGGWTRLEDALRQHPLTVYFADGSELTGGVVTPGGPASVVLRPGLVVGANWPENEVDITREVLRNQNGQGAESDELTQQQDEAVQVIQERVEDLLAAADGTAGCWVIRDDRAYEIADEVLLFEDDLSGTITIAFVHLKASARAKAGVRAQDLYELMGQCIKTRPWFEPGPALWRRLSQRVNDGSPVIVGDEGELLTRLDAWENAQPRRRHYVIAVQPGLDADTLETRPDSHESAAEANATLIQSVDAWLSAHAEFQVIGNSPALTAEVGEAATIT